MADSGKDGAVGMNNPCIEGERWRIWRYGAEVGAKLCENRDHYCKSRGGENEINHKHPFCCANTFLKESNQ
jgi:hypothetical protein